MSVASRFLLALFLLAAPLFAAAADAPDRAAVVAALCGSDNGARESAIDALVSGAAAADGATLEWAYATLGAFANRALQCTPDGDGYIKSGAGWVSQRDGQAVAELPADAKGPFLNLPLRRKLAPAVDALAILVAPEPAARIEAAGRLQRTPEQVPKALVERAIAEADAPEVRDALTSIRIGVILRTGTIEERIAALDELAANPTRDNRNRIEALRNDPVVKGDPALAKAVDAALSSVDTWLTVSRWLTTAYHGLSYGSVLFMAALGLAIIFGLMGVINLAQGEFIMLGAYMTWFVQEALRYAAPGLLDWYLLIAIPFAFGGPALMGMALEWAVVRHLYHRPLMTLLATWGISLLLINLVRVTIGSQNLNFYTPDLLASGFTVLGEFSVTWTRLLSIGFALATLGLTLYILFRTRVGLEIRATTQHRQMASCVGISTRRTDALAFGFGSGLAGLSGLALAMIYNVNPTMGTSLIIDSFIVVVVGGVGSVLGTGAAALGIGQMNALIEPLYGSVAAKVLVLLAVILFIQQKPNGLFPRKGRR